MKLKPKIISIFVLTYFMLIGFKMAIQSYVPVDWDSLVYHLPIAKNIVGLNLVPRTAAPFTFYPANIHLILSLFTIIPIPWVINLFNTVGLLALFWGAFYLSIIALRNRERAFLYIALSKPNVRFCSQIVCG